MHGLRYGIFHELEVRGRSQDVEVEAFPPGRQAHAIENAFCNSRLCDGREHSHRIPALTSECLDTKNSLQ